MKTPAFLGAILVAVCAPLAHAAIQITYSIDGGAAVTCTNASSAGPVTCPSVILAPISLTLLSASSNSPGTPSLAKTLGTTLEISNIDLLGATHTLGISIAAQGFTGPITPPSITFMSHIGGTVLTASSGSLLDFRSCVDPSNSLTACAGGSIVSDIGAPGIATAASFSDDKVGSIASLASGYSISQILHLTLGGGADLNLSTSTTLAPVPEPMSIVLFGAVLVVTSQIRRKRNRASEV